MRLVLAVSLGVTLAVLGVVAQSPTSNPFAGVWKQNPQRSKMNGTAPPEWRNFRRYEEQANGWMVHTISWSFAGGADFTFTTVRYDGMEYPVYTSSTLGAFLGAGNRTARTVAFKLTAPRTLEFTDRENGKVSATGVCTVSPDGKTLTEDDHAFDPRGKEIIHNVLVFDKQ
jgi:hypothetical protein